MACAVCSEAKGISSYTTSLAVCSVSAVCSTPAVCVAGCVCNGLFCSDCWEALDALTNSSLTWRPTISGTNDGVGCLFWGGGTICSVSAVCSTWKGGAVCSVSVWFLGDCSRSCACNGLSCSDCWEALDALTNSSLTWRPKISGTNDGVGCLFWSGGVVWSCSPWAVFLACSVWAFCGNSL